MQGFVDEVRKSPEDAKPALTLPPWLLSTA